jgi:hypothetical protein
MGMSDTEGTFRDGPGCGRMTADCRFAVVVIEYIEANEPHVTCYLIRAENGGGKRHQGTPDCTPPASPWIISDENNLPWSETGHAPVRLCRANSLALLSEY